MRRPITHAFLVTFPDGHHLGLLRAQTSAKAQVAAAQMGCLVAYRIPNTRSSSFPAIKLYGDRESIQDHRELVVTGGTP